MAEHHSPDMHSLYYRNSEDPPYWTGYEAQAWRNGDAESLKLMLDNRRQSRCHRRPRRLALGELDQSGSGAPANRGRGRRECKVAGGNAHDASASRRHMPKSTELLLAGGADSTLTDDNGDTPFALAVAIDSHEVIDLLAKAMDERVEGA